MCGGRNDDKSGTMEQIFGQTWPLWDASISMPLVPKNELGICVPSLRETATLTGLLRRSIIRVIIKLEEEGLIFVIREIGEQSLYL